MNFLLYRSNIIDLKTIDMERLSKGKNEGNR